MDHIDGLFLEKVHVVFWSQEAGGKHPPKVINRKTLQCWQQLCHGEELTLGSVRSCRCDYQR